MEDWNIGALLRAGTIHYSLLSPKRPDRPAFGPNQTPNHLVPWEKVEPHCKAKHSLPSAAEVKNAWSYTSIPTYVFMECFLIKQDKFTLLVT
jgi:hypothetical protein